MPRDTSFPIVGSSRDASAPARIADYALIGDCRSAALVSRDGTIDWLCLPHFASPSVFGALLDREGGGAFEIGPVTATGRSTRRYLEGSNVLETTFAADAGTFRIVDAMPIPCDAGVHPMREVLRCVEGLSGSVRVRVAVRPRPDYGLAQARLERRRRDLWAWSWGSHLLMLQSDLPLSATGTAVAGEFVVNAGERRWLSLTHTQADIGVVAGLGEAAAQRLEDTTAWWRRWSGRARYEGPHRDAVVRSALALKLLCCAQSGAVIAAPTASLPEWPGGPRNWDYRYCWLRDAALTMRAFTRLGYLAEARAFLDWLLHATRLTWPRLQVLYDVYGRTDVPERELGHWHGFRGSRPVRIGNAAHAQLQLDVYGAVCFAARDFVEATGELKPDEARLLRGFGDEVCVHWQERDHGIWEMRGPRQHYTFSKVMCWSALDSLLRLQHAGHMRLGRHQEPAREVIRQTIEQRAFSAAANSYVGILDGERADASLLLAGCLGYAAPSQDRMRGTFDYVHRRLGCNGLLLRYDPREDPLGTPEGAFAICSFFAVDHLAHRGEVEQAHAAVRHVLSFANDVGLLAEEIDPDTGELLGNFPQAYTHVGLIHAALAIAAAAQGAP